MSRNSGASSRDARKLPRSVAHKGFLIRSLNRNDTDLAALLEAQRRLKGLKRLLGEPRLLELGHGKIRLRNGGGRLDVDAGVVWPDTDEEERCAQFLQLFQLRRRLLNRMFRRLQRVALILDGETGAEPPLPPKYGEVRLMLQSHLMAQGLAKMAAQDAASMKRVIEQQQQQEESAMMKLKNEEVVKTETGEETTKPEVKGEATTEGPEKTTSTVSLEAKDEVKAEEETSAPKEETKDVETDQDDPMETGEAPKSSATPEKVNSNNNDENEQDEKEEEFVLEPVIPPEESIFLDYKVAYDKTWNEQTKTWEFVHVPLIMERFGVTPSMMPGVGAQVRMGLAEKQAEFNRWQAALSSKIPEQPTFSETVTETVFFAEERKKRIQDNIKKEEQERQQQQNSTQKAKESPAPGKKLRKIKDESGDDEDDDDDDDESMSDDSVSGDEKEKKKPKESPEKEKSKNDNNNNNNNEKEEVKDEDGDAEQEAKIVRPISLAAIPSFHDQDLRRIKLVHSDLMATSMQSSNRVRLEEATREYNTALNQAMQCEGHVVKHRNQLRYFQIERNKQMSQIKHDYKAEFAMARKAYLARRRAFETNKLEQLKPSNWGRAAEGTHMTRTCMSRPDPIAQQVGGCMADIVEIVDLVSQGKLSVPKFHEPFIPPRMPNLKGAIDPKTGENIDDRNKRIEEQLTKEGNMWEMKLRSTEEMRKKAWRKLVKLKAEYEMPPSSTRRRLDYSLVPVPPLHRSGIQTLPPVPPQARNMMPPQHIGTPVYVAPKYNAISKERISADGSVAPATEAKRGKDGLYLRPAGRTRKGMEWDAVRGIWVPQQHQTPYG